MQIVNRSPDHLKLTGGRLWLDFINTVDGRTSVERLEDHLSSYEDLVRWGGRAGVLDAARAGRLLSWARLKPEDAREAFERALALREALYRILLSALDGAHAAEDDLATLNSALAAALRHARLRSSGKGALAWDWEDEGDSAVRMLWPIARSAADLLTSPRELARVRQCPGAGCGWVFLDETKNRSRRWCDMEVCGNRAKARRHYARAHAGRD